MAQVLMYCTAACPFCQSAERLLSGRARRVEKVRVDLEPERRGEMTQEERPPHRAADLDRRAPCRRLRRSLRPRPQGGLDPLLEGDSHERASPSGASLQIEKLYVKDVSLEVPNAPHVFPQQAQPEVEVQIDTGAAAVRRRLFRGHRERHGDRARPVTRRCSWPRRCRPASSDAQRAGRAARAAARHRLPADPVPLPARGDLRPRGARRLPAGAARAGVVRGAVHAAHAAQHRAPRAPSRRSKSPGEPGSRCLAPAPGAARSPSVLAARLEVSLWARDPCAGRLDRRVRRRNERYLPGVEIPAAVEGERRPGARHCGADLGLAATPVAGLRDVAQQVRRADAAGLAVQGLRAGQRPAAAPDRRRRCSAAARDAGRFPAPRSPKRWRAGCRAR